MPCRAKAAVYLAMSSPWPTLAAACWVARSLGRRDSPSGTRPDAIAPDDTSTSCVPAWTRVARAAARASIASPAISPSVVVKDEEPTFTTTLSAPSMSGRATSGPGPPPGERLSRPQPGQPVRQVADRLIVAEVGLPDPPLRLLAADEEALPDPDHLEARFVGGLHDHPDPFGGLLGGAAGPVRRDQGGHGEAQLTQALAGRGGDLEDLIAAGLELGLDQVGLLAGRGHVDLVQRDKPRPPDQLGAGSVAVGSEFFLERRQVRDRVTAGQFGGFGGAVEHVDQGGAAFHVPQELMSQALALAGAPDQPGHVGHDELDVAGFQHAEVRDQGGERVVGDLRPGRGHRRDDRGLPGVGEADQPHVGHRLQLQDEIPLLARLALEREPRRLAPGAREGGVTQPAAAARGGYEPAAGADEIGEDLAVRGLHLGPVRHWDDQVGAVGAGPVRTLALLAVTGPADRAAVEVEQGRRARVHFEDHIPAVAAVAPVRAAERLELLAMNRGAAVPAVAGLHLQRDPVGELRHNAHLPQCM